MPTSPTAEASVRMDADLDLQELQSKLRKALADRYPALTNANGDAPWQEFVKTTSSYFVYDEAGQKYKVAYVIDQLTGEPQLQQRKPVSDVVYETAEGVAESLSVRTAEAFDVAVGSSTKDGWRWKVQILEEGLTKSANIDLTQYGLPGKHARRSYTAESISDAVKDRVFEARPLVLLDTQNHLGWSNGKQEKIAVGKESEMTAGMFSGITEGRSITDSSKKAVIGYLDLSRNKSGAALREHLLKPAAEAQRPQLSWKGDTIAFLENKSSVNPTLRTTKITEVVSVDLVPVGNAGGFFLAAESSIQKQKIMNEKEKRSILILLGGLLAKKPKGLNLKAAEAAVEGEGDADDLDTVVAQLFLDANPSVKDLFDSPDEFVKSPKFIASVTKWLKSVIATPADDTTDPDATPDGDPDTETKAAEARRAAEARKSKSRAAEGSTDPKFQAQLDAIQIQLSDSMLETAIAKNKDLPERIQKQARGLFAGKAAESKAIDAFFRESRDLVAELAGSSRGPNRISFIGKEDDRERFEKTASAFFMKRASEGAKKAFKEMYGYDASKSEFQRFRSLKDLWCTLYGLDDIGSSMFTDRNGKRAAEAFTGSLESSVAGDAMHRALLAEYRGSVDFTDWRKLATIESVNDFRQYHGLNDGYFTNPASTTGTANYTEMNLSNVEDLTLQATRYGIIFTLSYEDLKNDDVNRIQKVPGKMARAHHRAQYEAVMDYFWNAYTTQYSVADTNDIISTAHANAVVGSGASLGTTFSAARPVIIAARKGMMLQLELGSGKTTNVKPKFLLHMIEDEDVAYQVTTPAAGVGQNSFVATTEQAYDLERIVVPHWSTYTGRRTFLVASPQDIESVRIGFIDGREEPDVVQEAALTGLNFTADAVRFRSTLMYGVGNGDYRGVYGLIVS